jgi:hypothetical protein
MLGLKLNLRWVWWFMPIIPALGRPRQEDCEFQANLSYMARPCQEREKKRKKRREEKRSSTCFSKNE